MRRAFIAAGVTALVASTTMSIVAAGGLSAPTAPGLIAMAVVLAVGAAAIGFAWTYKHLGLAIVIGLGMVSGEIGAMVQTAHRVTAAREAQRAPLVAIEQQRAAAIGELHKAEAAVVEPVDRSRLEAAESAKHAAELAVREKSAERGCRENCRLLLQAAVDAAGKEVAAARAEIGKRESEQRAALTNRVETARAAVAALPAPRSATPLADYSGVPEWIIDLVEALTLSFAVNMSASALIALGVKRTPAQEISLERPEAAALHTVAKTQKALPAPKLKRSAEAEADHFGGAMLRVDPTSHLAPDELLAAYRVWCGSRNIEPLPVGEIAPAMRKMFLAVGLDIEDDGTAQGVTLRA